MGALKELGIANAATVVAIAAACAATVDGPPAIAIDRTPCAHCGMLISEPMFAAAYRVGGSAARAFDDVGCMLAEARREPKAAIRFWFHDAESGEWIDGTTGVFVTSAAVRTPMGGGVLAYGSAEGARRGAAAHQGVVIGSVEALLASPMKEGER